jgi:PII-like signaling protein
MERQHTIDIEDLHAEHRVESQRLEDDILNYSRRLATIEIEVSDARRKLDKELNQLDQIRQENQALRVI